MSRSSWLPLGVITGRVLDDDGDPVRGARWRPWRIPYQGGKKELRSVAQASANDKGEFRLFWRGPRNVLSPRFRHNRSRGIPDVGIVCAHVFSKHNGCRPRGADRRFLRRSVTSFDMRLRREPHYSRTRKAARGRTTGAERMFTDCAARGSRRAFPIFNAAGTMKPSNSWICFRESYVVIGTVSEMARPVLSASPWKL